MADRPPDWLSVAAARTAILQGISPLPARQSALQDALGFVLAEDITSSVDLPPWDNSAMDGFAVRGEDVRGATPEMPVVLPVVGDLAAGAPAHRGVGPGEAIRIMTGAPVPPGADTVVRVEHTDGGTDIGAAAGRVRVLSSADAGRNVRRRGEDLRAGGKVLVAGAVLSPAMLGVAASVGRARVSVVRRPEVAILTSGDELVEMERFAEVARGEKIVSSSSYALAGQLAEIGIRARFLGIAADTECSLLSHLQAARGCDALITTAGISMGEHDLLRGVLERHLGLRWGFWRVRMRPGSPVGFGWLDELGGMPWFGLPGNPVSSLVTLEVLVRPALLRMAGHAAAFQPTRTVTFQGSYGATGDLVHFPRARLKHADDDTVTATLTGPQGSGILTSLAEADALLVVPAGSPGTNPGDRLKAMLLGAAPPVREAGF